MANYCDIKFKNKRTTEEIGNLICQYFKDRFKFEVGVEIEKCEPTMDSLVLKFKDVNMYMWVYHNDSLHKNCVNIFDSADTCYSRSDNEDSKYDENQEYVGLYQCGYTFIFLMETVKSFLAKEFKSKLYSEGVGPYDPAKEKGYVLNYDNAKKWAKETYQSFYSKNKEQSYFPEFHK